MSDAGEEQNKSEEATPFKLRRAREKGQVARGFDLGFFGVLVGLAAFLLISGKDMAEGLARAMRGAIITAGSSGQGPEYASSLAGALAWPMLYPVMGAAGTILALVLLLEVVQLRGIVFTTHPLKPDFSRINPAKGLKRLFSMRMVKEAAKNVLKLGAYATVTWFVILSLLSDPGRTGTDAWSLAAAMERSAMRLLFLFILLALFFAALDQLIVRRQHQKQMRMSRRELTREAREREGEPRLKQKRKQLHAEFANERRGLGGIAGSDLLVVNPQHFAVALAYDPATMGAPTVKAKARNQFALAMKDEAFRLGIPMFEDRPLARGLYDHCDKGAEIDARHYRAVADLYTRLAGARSPATGTLDAC
ncbi:MAG: flagellar biosynthesis protein FlhB [Sphingomonadales bacterium]|jgi:flagellar biosynthetic protein FlhB|nr:flagellar biosynthesis protein FlhB [Sphingomonadales bacterium]